MQITKLLFLVIAGFGIVTEGLLPNILYEVRGQFIPTWPREMEWTARR